MNTNASTIRLAIAGLTLAVAACGSQQSSAPQSQEPARTAGGSVTPAPTVPGLIAEWQDAQLESSLEQNRYGDRQASLLRRDGAGHLEFAPKTAQDHVATPFVAVKDGTTSLELVLQANSPEGDACVANLQDQRYNLLATLPCAGSGERKTTAKLPGDVARVRVYFQSAKLEAQQLPARIQLIAPKG